METAEFSETLVKKSTTTCIIHPIMKSRVPTNYSEVLDFNKYKL
jgi:hypothetical protein